nr:PREDICTED: isopentenyl-diphosphate Delta-isomerase I-like [Nicotiana tabacum]
MSHFFIWGFFNSAFLLGFGILLQLSDRFCARSPGVKCTRKKLPRTSSSYDSKRRRLEKIEAENLLHRAFSVFLFNSKYELLLQQRSATKVTFPLVWTNTCCSHPLYRESELIEENVLGVRNAAQRKLLDELGIPAEDVPVDQFTPLGRILYKAPSDGKWGEHELDYLLFTVREVNMKPNPDEVADVKYVNREQLKELLRKADAGEEGLKLSPWFRLVVDNFLFKWWDHLEKGTLEEVRDMKTIHKLT